jgi:hypothetical protein
VDGKIILFLVEAVRNFNHHGLSGSFRGNGASARPVAVSRNPIGFERQTLKTECHCSEPGSIHKRLGKEVEMASQNGSNHECILKPILVNDSQRGRDL